MSEKLDDYLPAKVAAKKIGIAYSLLMSRIYKEKVKATKLGWSVFVHKDEVARERAAQIKRDKAKDADNKDMGRSTR